jgi:hypothetical protein
MVVPRRSVARVGLIDEWHVVVRKLLDDFNWRPFLEVRS